MVNLKIAGRKVHRILIDNRSLVDVLFSSTLDRMNMIGHTFTRVRTRAQASQATLVRHTHKLSKLAHA